MVHIKSKLEEINLKISGQEVTVKYLFGGQTQNITGTINKSEYIKWWLKLEHSSEELIDFENILSIKKGEKIIYDNPNAGSENLHGLDYTWYIPNWKLENLFSEEEIRNLPEKS